MMFRDYRNSMMNYMNNVMAIDRNAICRKCNRLHEYAANIEVITVIL